VQGEPPVRPVPPPIMYPPPKPGAGVRTIFRVWVLVFGLVGAQMAWIMRPFIGDPKLPFSWFRPKQSNIFEAIISAMQQMFS
jgi:hypothetical protein